MTFYANFTPTPARLKITSVRANRFVILIFVFRFVHTHTYYSNLGINVNLKTKIRGEFLEVNSHSGDFPNCDFLDCIQIVVNLKTHQMSLVDRLMLFFLSIRW